MSRRDEVERLLEQIRERMAELQLLKVYGVRAAGLEGRKRELRRIRRELAVLVSG